ncbi:MAG: DNA repair protein [Oceanospirillaceae bacterium]|uniref:DNA repair ATPase n=1 Tax=unclassified Thalassolituus TaxID=2624967 RepID=UPI000C53BDF6|nr:MULTISPECIES: DNA repair ATPase [unclassified Thalassolituus]MAS24160.1 DNA repair protein [Oceanospirillaceae bacterium]MAX99679.1 DNA repair protein [Oceanospirillaceae bacterium]|tara:strand:- start:3189 stop:8624 length:5436 start_codon:yes stop_codon:yes gene_type:complete
MAEQKQPEDVIDSAVAQGGAYEIIKKRLQDQGKQLEQSLDQLNKSRTEEFGQSDMKVVGRIRVRTENNCIARDMVQVGQHLLFGYNVFIGLKKETQVEDVFALFSLQENDGQFEAVEVPAAGTFLSEPAFVNDFDELYRYYKHTRLVELTVKKGQLLAGFQIGERLEDLRVFRWSVSADGKNITYIDNRGERDIQLPPAFDFEWTESTRDDAVNGRHPHINILDTVFVETVGGDLTIKIENNTQDGLGIYQEPVEDKTQSLGDASISYAAVGSLILLKVKPYREELWRHFIYNTVTETVVRVDAIGESCVQLPEDHGVIFPGGYYLTTGEFKQFDGNTEGMRVKRKVRSPNGEDMLYIFYQPVSGEVCLLAYNLIEKSLQNPVFGHGYALADSGQLVIFSAENEPTRVHPMQIWETPYQSAEFVSRAPASQTFFGRIGNAELVRGISDLYSVIRLVNNQSVSARLYEELSKAANKIFDDHYWVSETEVADIAALLKEIAGTSELVIDEFEKVQSIRQQSASVMRETEEEQKALVQSVQTESWDSTEQYVTALAQVRRQRGKLMTVRDLRYIDLNRIDELDGELQKVEATLSERTVAFLSDEQALEPYQQKIDSINQEVEKAESIATLTPVIETIDNTAEGMDLLSELMGTLQVDDATVRTRIIDAISQVYAQLNQSKARARQKQKSLGSAEAVAQFSAQFKLFTQSIANALGMSTTPEKCDEQLSRLLVQLEELESQFSEYDQFLADIMEKREELYESFESHKQQLVDEIQRKAQSVADAAARILGSIEKRSLKFTEQNELNTYFASDALVMKIREQVTQLRGLDASVKADDIESRLKAIKEQALRSLRDKSDIYEDGGNVIKLGPRHKFSVNTQELDLTIIPRNDVLNVHLSGTNYFEPIADPELLDLRAYWSMNLESETPEVYRGEYLATLILDSARQNQNGLSMDQLRTALLTDDLDSIVRNFAGPRYKEGYEKGIHDHDATLLLRALIPALDSIDLLRFDPLSRALAQVFWANIKGLARDSQSVLRLLEDKADEELQAEEKQAELSVSTWPERAQSAAQMESVFRSNEAVELLAAEVRASLQQFIEQHPIAVSALDIRRAADYLVAELGRDSIEFIGSKYAQRLVEELKRSMDDETWRRYQMALEKMLGWPAERWNLTTAWLQALVKEKDLQSLARYIPEAVALINASERLDRRFTETDLELSVEGLMGDHPLIQQQTLSFGVDAFLLKMERHRQEVVPAYQRYLQVRQNVTERERKALRLIEFKPRPLSSFVRNRLINESYLPLIGDNLAKQMGTVGENKRADLMGLLMMISPPGYGKTTLMEYVASRLGLIFMKINCPSLGHEVTSLDPQQAPDATSRKELEKLNLGLEMGNNVMLYLDDIQHTNPEFLQKFISLCDGTRRIDGVWKGETKTYDMRGRKFCVVMAGNPYTESGEAFKIPDMLANRADIYNLGDILGGMEEQFALSYIENALTSNQVLAPLAVRDLNDLYKLVDMAKGREVATTDLSYQYSGAEINEITSVLKKMMVVQDVVLKINQQYIASAAQDDKYRTEPTFKLQGSYRNMNKMTEKISAVMNTDELMQMIQDHYLGESQLLTTGAEGNLLKLAELRGNMTAEQQHRWEAIKADFLRNKAMGGDDADTGARVVAQLADLVSGVQAGVETLTINATNASQQSGANQTLMADTINRGLQQFAAAMENLKPQVNVINEPVPGVDKILRALADTLEHSIVPLVRSMDKKIDIDLRTHDKMRDISEQLRKLSTEVGKPQKKPALQAQEKTLNQQNKAPDSVPAPEQSPTPGDSPRRDK